MAWREEIIAQFCIMLSVVLYNNMKLLHDWNKSWHDLTGSEILFKHSLTNLLSKLNESHENQRREFLGYLDTKG